MGLFGKRTSKKTNEDKDEPRVPWYRLTTLEQLSEIKEISKEKPVAIFKHSTSCGISRMVLRNFENSYNLSEEKMQLYYLDLKAYRDVSNEVGYTFQVLHESPQLLVIKDGEAIAHASHHSISAEDLHQFV